MNDPQNRTNYNFLNTRLSNNSLIVQSVVKEIEMGQIIIWFSLKVFLSKEEKTDRCVCDHFKTPDEKCE